MIPEVNEVAEKVYDEIRPAAYADEENDWILRHVINGWTLAMYEIWLIVRDNGNTPGWSIVMSPETAPVQFLNWLSVLLGSKPIVNETVEQARIRLGGMSGLRRGSLQALRSVAVRSLNSGDPDVEPYVIFNERQGGNAYRLAIRTLSSQTPNEAQVASDLLTQKPGGIVMTYDAFDDITYDTVNAAYDTYQDLLDNYSSYGQMLVDLPD